MDCLFYISGRLETTENDYDCGCNWVHHHAGAVILARACGAQLGSARLSADWVAGMPLEECEFLTRVIPVF